MGHTWIDFTFDYVDPGSYLAHRLLARWVADRPYPIRVRWVALELRAPPASQLDPPAGEWAALMAAMERIASDEGIPFVCPEGLPWTRKAHELALHAREKGRFDRIHTALFEAHFVHALDIGRVDTLASLAEAQGLSGAEARTVLGVDRFAPEVERGRAEALAGGVRGVPTLETEGRRLEGFTRAADVLNFLDRLGGNDG